MKNKLFAILAIGLLAGPVAANAAPILVSQGWYFAGDPQPAIAVAWMLPSSDFYWANPPVGDSAYCAPPSCNGYLFADKGWSVKATNDPLWAGAGGPAILLGETWGYYATYFYADPLLHPTFVLTDVTFDLSRNAYSSVNWTFQFNPATGTYRVVASTATGFRPAWESVFVPEPGTLALLGLGLAGLGLSRRRAF